MQTLELVFEFISVVVSIISAFLGIKDKHSSKHEHNISIYQNSTITQNVLQVNSPYPTSNKNSTSYNDWLCNKIPFYGGVFLGGVVFFRYFFVEVQELLPFLQVGLILSFFAALTTFIIYCKTHTLTAISIFHFIALMTFFLIATFAIKNVAINIEFHGATSDGLLLLIEYAFVGVGISGFIGMLVIILLQILVNLVRFHSLVLDFGKYFIFPLLGTLFYFFTTNTFWTFMDRINLLLTT